jgi:hypothetical protein
MQTVTFMDPAGNVAQYAVYDGNSRGEYHWSTDHGDSGSEMSSARAQITARMALKPAWRPEAGWIRRPGTDPSRSGCNDRRGDPCC